MKRLKNALDFFTVDKHLAFPHPTLTVDYIYRAVHFQERNDDSSYIYPSGPVPCANQQDIPPDNKIVTTKQHGY